eukprot:TRINITY_DN5802_c0_g3_i1.p1 TRINITY_DN5802_c0_g3~~TRINITY_DN5802_c0_g3_i1.p1  ORF type:complete len:369 (-),score=114.00 TRINITY_DN5802_c0_g3_i1:342-1448(-)
MLKKKKKKLSKIKPSSQTPFPKISNRHSALSEKNANNSTRFKSKKSEIKYEVFDSKTPNPVASLPAESIRQCSVVSPGSNDQPNRIKSNNNNNNKNFNNNNNGDDEEEECKSGIDTNSSGSTAQTNTLYTSPDMMTPLGENENGKPIVDEKSEKMKENNRDKGLILNPAANEPEEGVIRVPTPKHQLKNTSEPALYEDQASAQYTHDISFPRTLPDHLPAGRRGSLLMKPIPQKEGGIILAPPSQGNLAPLKKLPPLRPSQERIRRSSVEVIMSTTQVATGSLGHLKKRSGSFSQPKSSTDEVIHPQLTPIKTLPSSHLSPSSTITPCNNAATSDDGPIIKQSCNGKNDDDLLIESIVDDDGNEPLDE